MKYTLLIAVLVIAREGTYVLGLENSTAEPTDMSMTSAGSTEPTGEMASADGSGMDSTSTVSTGEESSITKKSEVITTTAMKEEGCKEEKNITVNNMIVNQNVSDCDAYQATEFILNVNFVSATVGRSALADVFCKKTCDDSPGARSIGIVQCLKGGTWDEAVWTDCSLNASIQSISQKLANAYITSAGDLNKDGVSYSVNLLAEVSNEEIIVKADADNFVDTVNNLVQATDEDAVTELQSEYESLLQSLEDLTTIVELAESDDKSYSFYERVDSNFALCVVGDASEATNSSKATADTFYFGTDEDWNSNYNLAASSLELGTTEPAGVYIKATPEAGERLSFEMYSQVTNIFPNFEKVQNLAAVTVIYSVSGNTNSFEMKFRLNENITAPSGGVFNRSGDSFKQLKCLRRVAENGWSDSDGCDTNSAKNFYATCTCSKPGEYTMRTISGVDSDNSLSGGAIAGIVIGSIAGAALLGWGGYYLYAKKKNKSGGYGSTSSL